MMIRSGFMCTAATILLGIALCGCQKDTSEPAPPSSASSTPPPNGQDDLKAATEFLNKSKTDTTSTRNPTLPAGHPTVGSPGGAVAAAGAGADAVTYTAPADWKPEPVSTQMRKAQFLIPRAAGDNEDGQMVVFYFGKGQGGAVESNIDRWKKMFSTADGQPVADAAIKRESREVNGLKVTTLDITGKYVDPMAGKTTAPAGEWRMLSAIVETAEGPWFFKGVGPAATMKAEEGNFKRFVASIKGKS